MLPALRLAEYVGAEPGNLAFAPNASSALNAVVRSLDLRPRRRGAARRRRVRRDGAAVGLRRRALRRDARAPAVLGARTGTAHARRLLLAHRMDERPGQRRRGALPAGRARRARSRSSTALTPRGRSISTSTRSAPTSTPATATSGCARRRASGFLYARPEAQALDRRRRSISWDWLDGAAFPERHRWQGTRDPSAYLAVPGRDRLPGRARLAGRPPALPRAARRTRVRA